MRGGPRPLDALVARLADGDRSAFDPVYDAVEPQVRGVCRRLLGDGPDADDAVQQALIRVFERVSDWDPARGPALGWVLTTAAWEARTLRRRNVRRREAPLEAEPAAVEVREPLEDVVRAVAATLDPIDRDALLTALAGERPAGATFRKRLQRAIGRVRVALGRSDV